MLSVQCAAGWVIPEIQKVLEQVCAGYSLGGGPVRLTAAGMNQFIAESAPLSKGASFLGSMAGPANMAYKANISINASGSVCVVNINYEEPSTFKSGALGKKYTKIFWDGFHTALGTVLGKPYATYASATETTSPPLQTPESTPVQAVVLTPEAPKFCSNCGKPIDPGAKFCMRCGKKVV